FPRPSWRLSVHCSGKQPHIDENRASPAVQEVGHRWNADSCPCDEVPLEQCQPTPIEMRPVRRKAPRDGRSGATLPKSSNALDSSVLLQGAPGAHARCLQFVSHQPPSVLSNPWGCEESAWAKSAGSGHCDHGHPAESFEFPDRWPRAPTPFPDALRPDLHPRENEPYSHTRETMPRVHRSRYERGSWGLRS